MNAGLICIPVCAKTAGELVAQIRRAERLADIIEVRFDCIDRGQIASALAALKASAISKPLIATYRSPDQGGNDPSLTLAERSEFWRNLPAGFTYADLEQDVVDAAPALHLIASEHHFAHVSHDVTDTYTRLSACSSSIIKIAEAANDVCDGIPIWKILERARADSRQIIPIAMGEAGKWTRILALAHGAFLTYASLDADRGTAGGQFTAEESLDVYRIKRLDPGTKVYGVVGDPVSSSVSPYMHNAAFAACEMNSVFVPLQVTNLDAFMRRMVLPATREVELNIAGFAVTMPHKQSVQKYLKNIDPIAEKIGAINTISIDHDQLTGYNTDAPGFLEPLKQRVADLKDANVAVLGAGGAARAVVYALQQEGAVLTLFARDLSKAQALAHEFEVRSADVSTINHPPSTIDILVNTTPLGMRGNHEDKSPLTADDLSGVRFVYDLVTRADDTPLIREAKRAGIPTIGGAEMLISQGIKQFEIWTGREAPADLMRQAVLDRLK